MAKGSPEKEAARDRNRSKRLQQMNAGFDELENWLGDVIRQGIANAAQQPPEFWEEIAARMVDVKLSRPARQLRQMAELSARQADWPDQMLDELSSLYLLSRAFRQYEHLPKVLRQEVIVQAGINLRREELLKEKGLQDRWQLIGRREGREDNLKLRQIWLQGQQSGRIALLLDFVYHRLEFKEHWPHSPPFATAFDGELVFYPTAWPLRAIVKSREMLKILPTEPVGFATLEEMLEAFAKALAGNPWLPGFPCYLHSVQAVMRRGEAQLIDAAAHQIPLQYDEPAVWKLIALSAAGPIGLFGEWTGRLWVARSAWAGGRLVLV